MGDQRNPAYTMIEKAAYNIVDIVNTTENFTYCVTDCLHLKGCVAENICRQHIQEYIYPTPIEWIFIVLFLILFLFGLFGNALVCYVVVNSHHMQTVVNIFIFNLAFADFLVILFCLPPSVLSDVTETWYLGEAMCKIIRFLQTTSVSVSVMTLSAIAVERYFAICQPLKVRLTPKTIIRVILLIWLAGMAAAAPEIIFNVVQHTYPARVTNYLVYCYKEWSPEVNNQYQLVILIVLYSIPICLMAFTYSVISRHLWRNDIPGTTETNHVCFRKGQSMTSSPENQLYSRRRAAKMLMTIVVMFAVCYLPVHILNLIRYTDAFFLIGEDNIRLLALLSHLLCYINSAVNPVIYNFMSAKFRKEFQMALSCCRCPFRSRSHIPPGMGSSSRNRSSIPRTERYTMNTVSTKQPAWINHSAVFRRQ